MILVTLAAITEKTFEREITNRFKRARGPVPNYYFFLSKRSFLNLLLSLQVSAYCSP
jgi:hypothetical protein